MAKNVTSDMQPESHTGQDIIDIQDASPLTYVAGNILSPTTISKVT
jgi:hypothetical protein